MSIRRKKYQKAKNIKNNNLPKKLRGHRLTQEEAKRIL